LHSFDEVVVVQVKIATLDDILPYELVSVLTQTSFPHVLLVYVILKLKGG
jgi:hypothetical protein